MLAVGGVSLLGLRLLRRLLVRRFGLPAVRRGTTPPSAPDVETVDLPGPAGRTLRGLVLRAERATGTALAVHGWGGSAADLLPVGRLLQDEGLDVLLLDARGHGRSDDTPLTSMPHFAEDVAAAVRWWRTADLSPDRLLLVGHSVGAGACALVARDEADVAGLVLIASMAHPREAMRRLLTGAGAPRVTTAPALRLVEGLIGHRFDAFAPRRVLPLLDIPVLLVHGERDATIPVADALALAAAARDVELVVVPDAGHSDLDAVPAVAVALRRLLARTPVRTAHGSAAGGACVSRSRTATTSPDSAVNTATAHTAARKP